MLPSPQQCDIPLITLLTSIGFRPSDGAHVSFEDSDFSLLFASPPPHAGAHSSSRSWQQGACILLVTGLLTGDIVVFGIPALLGDGKNVFVCFLALVCHLLRLVHSDPSLIFKSGYFCFVFLLSCYFKYLFIQKAELQKKREKEGRRMAGETETEREESPTYWFSPNGCNRGLWARSATSKEFHSVVSQSCKGSSTWATSCSFPRP